MCVIWKYGVPLNTLLSIENETWSVTPAIHELLDRGSILKRCVTAMVFPAWNMGVNEMFSLNVIWPKTPCWLAGLRDNIYIYIYMQTKPSNSGSDTNYQQYIDGLAQDCSNSIANALELLQTCTKMASPAATHTCCYWHSSGHTMAMWDEKNSWVWIPASNDLQSN